MAASINIKVNSDFAAASKDLKEFGNVSQSELKKIQNQVASFKTEQIDSFIDKSRRMGAAAKATSGDTKSLAVQQQYLNNQMQSLIKKGFDPQDDAVQQLAKEYDRLEDQVQANITKQKAMENSSKLATSGMIALGAAASSAAAGIALAVTKAAEIEDIKAAFTPLVGGAEEAEELVSKLNETAATTPFQLEEISNSAKRLLPALGNDMEAVVDTFRMLGDTAGGNAQKLESITQGYSKAMLKGKVDMEALNQIADAGVPIYSELADSMGVSVAEMTAMSSAGEITSDDLTAAFQQMTSEGGIFFNGMSIASETFNGKLSTLKDNVSLAAAAVGNNFLPAGKEMLDVLISGASRIREFAEDEDKVKKATDILVPVIAGLTAGMITFFAVTKGGAILTGIITAFKSLNAIIAANPIGFLATVIVSVLVPAIIYLVKNWDSVVVVLSTTVEKLKERFAVFAAAIQVGWTVAFNGVKIVVLQLAQIILDKLLGAVQGFLELAGKLPFVGEKFQDLASSVGDVRAGLVENIQAAKDQSQAMIDSSNGVIAQKHLEAQEAIAQINLEKEERLAALKAQEDAQGETSANIVSIIEEQEAQVSAVTSASLSDRLSEMENAEAVSLAQRSDDFQNYLDNRLEQEQVSGDDRVAFIQSELSRIQDAETLSNEEKISAAQAAQDKITEIESEANEERKKLLKNYYQVFSQIYSSLTSVLSSYFDTAMNNIEVEYDTKIAAIENSSLSEEEAAAQTEALEKEKAKKLYDLKVKQFKVDKATSIIQTGIAGAQAAIQAFAMLGPVAGAVAAAVIAGLTAAEIGFISAKQPPAATYQTGTGLYGVPPSNSTSMADKVPIMVSPEERVVPRGESAGNNMTINVIVKDEVIWSSVQRGLDSGEITVSEDNIRAS